MSQRERVFDIGIVGCDGVGCHLTPFRRYMDAKGVRGKWRFCWRFRTQNTWYPSLWGYTYPHSECFPIRNHFNSIEFYWVFSFFWREIGGCLPSCTRYIYLVHDRTSTLFLDWATGPHFRGIHTLGNAVPVIWRLVINLGCHEKKKLSRQLPK